MRCVIVINLLFLVLVSVMHCVPHGAVEYFQQQLESPSGPFPAGDRDNQDNDAVAQGSKEEEYFCFENKCRCTATTANCSGNYGQLTYIPKLPDGIRELYFTHNALAIIQREDFFVNVTEISVLSLAYNELTYVSPSALQRLKRMNYLNLNDNRLSYKALSAVLSAKHNIQRLDVKYQGLGPIPDGLFSSATSSDIETLNMHGNNLKHLKLAVFAPLRNLREFGCADCKIRNLNTEDMPYTILEEINLASNAIMEFPRTCVNGTTLFPRLTHLYLDQNIIRTVPNDICLPSLRLLQLNGNLIRHLTTGMFDIQKFPAIMELYLEDMNTHIQTIERQAFNNAALEKISLMYNNLEFAKDFIDQDCFLGCHRLNNLQLGHNFFNDISDEKFHRLFSSLTQLDTLFLGSCGINRISNRTFAGLTSVRKIWLYLNRLTDIPDGAFDALTLLTYLDLNDNKISMVRETTFSMASMERLQHLDLSGNPFMCSCGLLWFRSRLLSDPAIFNRSYSAYMCSNIPNTSVTAFYLPQQTCLFSPEVNKFIVAIVSLSLLLFSLVSALYRYRWHIRLVLYEAFRGRSNDRRQRLLTGQFRYDVFVCYDAEDVDWVRGHLMPEIEGRLGLQLCVHQRDFRPGQHIVENIVHSVESSKKIVMLFSKQFAQSPWCQFELNLCLSHVVENDDALVVVCLDDVSSRDLTPAMMAVLKTTTYIQWEEDPDATASFWGRLKLALEEVLPAATVSSTQPSFN